MSDDDNKKSKARLLADSINEAHPARANYEYAQTLEQRIKEQTEQLNAGKGDIAILALGHGRFQPEPPQSDYVFIFTCLDDDDEFDKVQSDVMYELFKADKNTRLQKQECLEVHHEVLRRLGRAA